MKYVLLLMVSSGTLLSQVSTMEQFQENRWIVNSGINLPAIKFHFADDESEIDQKGYVELFSSFGVGLSLNFGKTTFQRNVKTLKLDHDNIKFSNIIGLQFGILYSSKVGENSNSNNLNYFSLYSGINILDLQLGVGKELGATYKNSNGWFLSISYGIPIYKLRGQSSFMLTPKDSNNNNNSESQFSYSIKN